MPRFSADGARVLADLHALRGIGAYKTGVHRPSLSPPHLESIRWLEAQLKANGLTPAIDGIGNVIGTAGRRKALLCGSHLESQNHSGWLDGPLGVVYALEAARVLNPVLKDAGIDVAAWCDEEGHFGPLLGSRSYVGQLSDEEMDAAVERTEGRRLRDALATAGFAGRPRFKAEAGRYIGYLEAHIEQGDLLEHDKLDIGVVTSIVGIWQFKIVVSGVQNHAGTTRMAIRKDAGVAAAQLLVELHRRLPRVAGPRTVWTVGNITLVPGAPSIIPGRAELLFQVRDADPQYVARIEAETRAAIADANRAGPCETAIEVLRTGQPAHMSATVQEAIEAAAAAHGASTVRMPSGAGHDAQFLSFAMPAGMLFVPSIGGISHHWTENTSDADIVRGAHVFVDTCARLLAA
jgi:beta-ureidopropionase / N-carbamoyl-L-amino-acid hydrolase